jgi:hypothetical protein
MRFMQWVPDVRSARFAAEAHREARVLAEADRRNDDMDFVEAIWLPVAVAVCWPVRVLRLWLFGAGSIFVVCWWVHCCW